MHGRRRAFGILVVLIALVGMTGTVHGATPIDTTALQEAVEVGNQAGTDGIREHLRALQEIADEPGANGTRATGTQGHEESVAYVMSQLDTSYWNVTTQPFEADVFTELADPELEATPPANPAWVVNEDFFTMEFSGTGSFTGPIAIIDFAEPTAQASTSSAGCDDADFPAGADSLAGTIAVIQRGTCEFGVKVVNAQAHGAAGVLIFNEGTLGDPDRNGPIGGTLAGYDGDGPRRRIDVRRRPLSGRQPDRHPSPRCLRPDRAARDAQRDRGVEERPK